MSMERPTFEQGDLADFQKKAEYAGEDLAAIGNLLRERDAASLNPIFGTEGSSLFARAAASFAEFSKKPELSDDDLRELEASAEEILGTFDSFTDWAYNPEIRDSIDNLEGLERALDRAADDLQILASSAEPLAKLQEAGYLVKKLVERMGDAKFQISKKKEAILAI